MMKNVEVNGGANCITLYIRKKDKETTVANMSLGEARELVMGILNEMEIVDPGGTKRFRDRLNE